MPGEKPGLSVGTLTQVVTDVRKPDAPPGTLPMEAEAELHCRTFRDKPHGTPRGFTLILPSKLHSNSTELIDPIRSSNNFVGLIS